MNYIVFDLEFNQGYKSRRDDKPLMNPQCPFEIIQIGAVKLDETFKVISSLDIFIKPVLYTELHSIVKEMTGITIEELNKAKPFKEIYKELTDFINKDDMFVIWGAADIKELYRNVNYHELDTSLLPKKYINIQRHASKHFKCPKGINMGLQNTVELLNISFEDNFHNAFNDARYTAEIFKKLYSKSVKPQTYTMNKSRNENKRNTSKHKIDTYALIRQFEKMFKREMTQDEKSIIKLAYMMGKTNQFTISNDNDNKRLRET